jgi:OFA family oxalate/formate antiporter-like MFS transporter
MVSNAIKNTANRHTRIFYGWYIVIVAFFGHFMATGMVFYIFNAFINPLCETRNWSRTEINAAPGIGFFVGIIGTLICGILIKRVGVRGLMAVGAIVAGTSFATLGLIENIWIFYLGFVFLSLGGAAISGIVANTMVSNWFVLKRGKAMGISSSGISLSGVFLPYAAMLILVWAGIETAFVVIGLMLLILAPIAWLVVKDNPEDFGLTPNGVAEDVKSEIDTSADPTPDYFVNQENGDSEWSLDRLIRISAFWKVGIAYGLMVMCAGPIMFQLAPRFIEIGFNRDQAMLMLALTALFGACGKYVWGMLCDYFEPRRLVALLMALTGLGVFFGLLSGSLLALALFIICFGFSMGGIMSTHPIITADLFGRKSFATVYKYLFLFMALEALGFILMGLSFDFTGSYNAAFISYIFTCLIAAGLVFSVKRPKFSLKITSPNV